MNQKLGLGGTVLRARAIAAVALLAACSHDSDNPDGSESEGENSNGVAIPTPTAIQASIGPDGGTASLLYFAVIGDTRPATINDTAGYPSHVIRQLFEEVATLAPMPPFVVGTGDYVYSTPDGIQADQQFALYLEARGLFPGSFFPAMGNHDCDRGVVANCPRGRETGTSRAYARRMLQPIRKMRPYYTFDVAHPARAWSAKFVVIAANAWDEEQAAWLRDTMARPTTYTFVVRHEQSAARDAPGVVPSDAIVAQWPYTLAIVGHVHKYAWSGGREVIIGNGGAPLLGRSSFGVGLFQQRADGAIQVDMIDPNTQSVDRAFRFAVHADGSAAP